MRHAATSPFAGMPPLSTGRAASALAAALARATWLLGWPGRVAAVRRDMALLGSMSAVELADIGLSRQDVHDAAALPLGEPPGLLLSQRAAERRRAALARRR